MKRFFCVFAAALVVLSGCRRDATGTDDKVATVQVLPGGRVLAVGEVLQLTAVVRDEGGEVPSDKRMAALAWSSSDPAVATVSASGVATGVAPGTATLRAELEGVGGSVQVTVAPTPAGCDVAASVRSLEVGGSVTLGGVQAATVCLDGGLAGKEYVAVPFHAGEVGAPLFSVRMQGQGMVPVVDALRGVAPALMADAGREADMLFHEQLRRRAQRELAPHVDAALNAGPRDPMGPSLVLDLRTPSVGQQVQVNTSLTSCESPSNRTGRVVAVGQRAIVLADLSNPAGGLTSEDYASLAAGFDTLVHPVVTQAFGEPQDVDGNGRVVIFYTSAVNALTPAGSSSFVGGFFHARDLFPTRTRDGLSACAGSNYAEMFYMLVPDPQGTVNGNVFSRDGIVQTSLGTIAHEYQHLINASRRLYVVKTTHWNEETWLNEGLSHIAEEIMFYRAAGLSPGQNLTLEQVRASPAINAAFNTYMDQNIRRYSRFLENHEGQSPYMEAVSGNDLAMRGASWAFMRYVADQRAGGTETELWRGLVQGSVTGFANLQRVLGTDPRPMMRDWTTSVFTDDVVGGLEPRFLQPSWNFRSFFSAYPVTTRNLAGGDVTVMLRSGSGTFARFGVAPGLVGTFRARQAGGDPLPSQMFVNIVRTR